MKAWLNGKFIKWDRVKVSLLTHSFGRGSALFEVLDIVSNENGTALFGIDEHIDRLFNSARLMYMKLPMTKEEIIRACIDTVKKNKTRVGMLKLYAYYSGIELTSIPNDTTIDIAIFTIDFNKMHLDLEELSKPVDVLISSYRKYHPQSVPVQAKVSGNYVNPYLSLMEGKEKGLDNVITLDLSGNIAEGATSSAFFVKDGKIKVPALDNVLSGITRMAVIEAAKDIGIEVEITDIPHEEVGEFEEAFYSGSVQHVQPIRSIDGKTLSDCCPGPVTENVMGAMKDVYEGKNSMLNRWLTYIKGV
ncbi:aminotransferase class IV [Spirochaetota bacterium]